MALSFPRQPVVEFYLDKWRDVSLDVRQKPAITITHGRKDWATKLSPASCKFTLDDGPDHGDGDYDPYNPLGQWFDYLGRSTPVRVALRYGADDFGRVVASGWGDSPDMGAWTRHTNNAGSVATDVNGNGRHLVSANSTYVIHYLDDVDHRDIDVSVNFAVNVATVTGGVIEPANILVRGQDPAGSYYMLRCTLTTGNQMQLSLMMSDSFTLAGPVTVLSYANGVAYTIRAQVEGDTLRGKLWPTLSGEPLDWDVEYSLTSADTQFGAGWVGVRTGVGAGNSNSKPVIINYDNLDVRLPRFAGETVKLQPNTTVDHADRTTAVEAASIRRRLAKGEKPLATALRRWIGFGGTPFGVADFWPLDEDENAATRADNTQGGVPAVFVRGPVSGLGALKYGEDSKFPPVPKCVELSTDGRLQLDLTSGNFNTANGFGFVWLHKMGPGCRAFMTLNLTTGEQIFLTYDVGQVKMERSSGGIVTVMTVPIPEAGSDTSWHVYGLGVRQSGGNILYDFAVDDDHYEVPLAGTAGTPTRLAFFANSADNSTIQITHVTSLQRGLFNTVSGAWPYDTIRDIYLGRPGETAANRFTRLCAEEGVATTLVGSPIDTPAMGPQTPLPLMKLLDECITVDQGSAFDPRGTTALGMRTLRATTARDPVLTLDYASRHVAPDFGPITDDQPILNDVTAKRPNGGEYQVEQLTGPNNVQDPGTAPGAAGRADTSVTTNVASDAQLPDQAGWRVHMGTVDAPRYSSLTVDLAAPEVASDPDLVSAVMDVAVDDHVDITGAQSRRIFDDVRLIVRGYTEHIGDAHLHRIVFNTEPYAPLDVAVFDDADARWGTAGSQLASSISSSATSFSVSVTAGEPWTQTAARFPLDIWVGGERIRISAIGAPSASTPPLTQTFTVDTGGRAVNGVTKAHSSGTKVRLFHPVYYGT